MHYYACNTEKKLKNNSMEVFIVITHMLSTNTIRNDVSSDMGHLQDRNV